MPNEKARFAERLNDALDNIHFPKSGSKRQAQLAEVLGTPTDDIGRWLKGESFPKTSALVKLSDLTQTRSNWLLSGQGKPYRKDMNPRGENKKPPLTGKGKLSKEAFDLGLLWMKLPKQQREAMARVIEELAASGKAK
jgi:hypothetical protein